MCASGVYGELRACAGIVSHVDLTLGAAAREVLAAHIVAGGGEGGRFKGIRHAGGWDASPQIRNSHTNPPPGLYADASFREGFAQLAPLGLSFEAWQFHPQLPDVIALARAFPDTAIILNHLGGPLGVGPYAGKQDQTFAQWQRHMAELATCPNLTVKLGGLGMKIGPFDHHAQPLPPSAQTVADAWRPWVETAIEQFGAARCMFESNFPVDKGGASYAVLWNAFKRIAAGASADDKAALFAGTAQRVYKL
jgi:predicted TIM-barrel fold metal-dependent hydrolase